MHRVPVPPAPAAEPPALFAGPEVHVMADDGREPPYPGAVQDELTWHLAKYLREDAVVRVEVPVEIAGGPAHGAAYFTLDLAVDVPVAAGVMRRVAFEAGSPARPAGVASLRDHDRLLRRDATVLAVGAADTLYRLRGSDLLHHMNDVLFLASQWDPEMFSERGRINLRTLASPEAKAVSVRPEQPSVFVPYALDPDAATDAPERHLWHVANGQTPHVLVRRLDRRLPAVWASYAADGFDVTAAPAPLRRVEAEPLRKTG